MGGSIRSRLGRGTCVVAAGLAMLVAGAAPTLATTCIQVTGEGVALFFQFKGKLPQKPNTFQQLSGRFDGVGPAYGAASVAEDGSFAELAGGFASGGTVFGDFSLRFAPPKSKVGSGGVVIDDTLTPVDAEIVSCRKEPKPKKVK